MMIWRCGVEIQNNTTICNKAVQVPPPPPTLPLYTLSGRRQTTNTVVAVEPLPFGYSKCRSLKHITADVFKNFELFDRLYGARQDSIPATLGFMGLRLLFRHALKNYANRFARYALKRVSSLGFKSSFRPGETVRWSVMSFKERPYFFNRGNRYSTMLAISSSPSGRL
jgi:hypothetical protein